MAMTTILMMLEMQLLVMSSTAKKIKHGMSTKERSTIVCMGN